MPTNSRDAAALWDMGQALQEIQEGVSGLDYEAFLENRTVRRAVERNFEIMGEAARRVSASFQAQHADIDWGGIIGLRNVLAHQYEVIRYEILWDVIGDNLPTLKPRLEALLPPLADG